MEVVDLLHSDLGRTVIMVLHDLNLAARYSDILVVMKDGAVVAQGAVVIEDPGQRPTAGGSHRWPADSPIPKWRQ